MFPIKCFDISEDRQTIYYWRLENFNLSSIRCQKEVKSEQKEVKIFSKISQNLKKIFKNNNLKTKIYYIFNFKIYNIKNYNILNLHVNNIYKYTIKVLILILFGTKKDGDWGLCLIPNPHHFFKDLILLLNIILY